MAYDYDFQNFQSTADYKKIMDMLTEQILSGDSQQKRKAAEALAKVVNAASTQDNNKLKAILAQEAAKQTVENAELVGNAQRDKMLGQSAVTSGVLSAAGGVSDLIGGLVEDRANAQATDDERYARILASIKTPGYNQTAQSLYGDSPLETTAKALSEGKSGEAQVKRARAAVGANALKRVGNILRALQSINDATRFAKSGTGAGTLLAAKGLATIGMK